MLLKSFGASLLTAIKTAYHIYMLRTAPIEANQITLIPEEFIDYQPNRPHLSPRCLYTNGSSDGVQYDLGTTKINQNDYTYVAWVKLPATGFPTLFQKTYADLPSNALPRFGFQISRQQAWCYAGTTSANTYWNTSTLGLQADIWYLVVLKYDSSETGHEGRLWINGVEIARSTYYGNTTSNVSYDKIRLAYASNGSATGGESYWNGYIKYAASYDYAIDDPTGITSIADLPTDYEINGVFEECEAGGSVTTVYSNNGIEGSITTADITAVRVEQVDAPLLASSGDVVGFGTTLGLNQMVSNPYEFYVSPWNSNSLEGCIVTPNAILSPDGVDFADKLSYKTNGTGFHLVRQFGLPILYLNSIYKCECYFKAGEENFAAISWQPPNSNGNGVVINLVDGSLTGINSAYDIYSENVGDGWWYVSFLINSGNNTGTATLNIIITNNANSGVITGVIGEGIYAWGAQCYLAEDVPVPKLSNSNTDINGNALIYTGRKDQPLQVGGAAVNLDTTRNKEIQSSTSLTGYSVIAVYGEVGTTGEQIQIADIGIDTVNDKLYNANAVGYDIKLARVDLSNGLNTIQFVYLGGLDNNGNEVASDKLYDASQVGGETATIIYDTQDYHTSQKYYNHWVLYGASQNKILNIQDSTEISQPNDTSTYVRFEMQDFNGNDYSIGGYPNADPLLDTKYDAVNNRIQIADSNTAAVYGFIQLNEIFDKGDIRVNTTEYFANGTYTLAFSVRDNSRLENFKSYMLTNHSVVVSDSITGQQFLYSLDKSHPDGNNYPNIQLGWTGVTCDDVIAALGTVITDVPLYTSLLTTEIAGNPSFGIIGRMLELIYTNNSILGEFTLDSDTIKASAFDEIGYFNPNESNKDNIFQTYRFATVRVDYNSATQVTIYVNEFTIEDSDVLAGLTDGSNNDSKFNKSNEYPFGTHLNNTQKQYVQLPPFKTLEYAYQSNEEYWRDKVDSQGNAVLDRHLVPISLGHSDKGFPCWRNGGTDYATFSTPITLNQNKHTFEALVCNYTDMGYGTLFGFDGSDNYIFGLNNDFFVFRIGTYYDQDTGLDLSDISNFIISISITLKTGNLADIEYYIIDLSGNILASWIDTDLSAAGTSVVISYLFTSFQTTARRNWDNCDTPWIKHYVDDVLTHQWEYLGNNSYLLQDKVGGNHGTLTTADISANQGTQDVYNPFVDGSSIKRYYWDGVSYQQLILKDVKIDTTDEYYEIRFKPFKEGFLLSYGSGYYLLLLVDGRIQYYSNPSTVQTHITTATINYNEWNVVRFTKTVSGHNITINGVTEQHNSIDHMWFRDIGSSIQIPFKGIVDYVDAGSNGYWQNNNDWADEVGSTDGVNNASYLVHTLIPLPKHPYNGTDVFGNPLTTPRTKAVTKAFKYTQS